MIDVEGLGAGSVTVTAATAAATATAARVRLAPPTMMRGEPGYYQRDPNLPTQAGSTAVPAPGPVDTTWPAPATKSRTPYYIAGGVAVLVAVGGVIWWRKRA